MRQIAHTLLWLYALGATGLIAAVRAKLVAARPEDAFALAVLPLVAGALAARERAWGLMDRRA